MKKNIRITKCYLVEYIDDNQKELCSDFCFGSRKEAEKLGKKLKENYTPPTENDGVVLGA